MLRLARISFIWKLINNDHRVKLYSFGVGSIQAQQRYRLEKIDANENFWSLIATPSSNSLENWWKISLNKYNTIYKADAITLNTQFQFNIWLMKAQGDKTNIQLI